LELVFLPSLNQYQVTMPKVMNCELKRQGLVRSPFSQRDDREEDIINI
jgi:hypothetical protein